MEFTVHAFRSRLHRPVPARIRLREAEVAEVGSAGKLAAFGNTDGTDQVEQMRRKQAVETALAGLAIKRGDQREDDDQGDDRPKRGKGDYPERERTRPEPQRKRFGDGLFCRKRFRLTPPA